MTDQELLDALGIVLPRQMPCDGVSHLPERFNVCGFDPPTKAYFVGDIWKAVYTRAYLKALGSTEVRIYDTVEGIFY